MALSSIQLEAFWEVARTGSFSQAAKNLHVTQSALSQRIMNLETELQTAVFVRDPAGLRLTAGGEELIRYCQAQRSLENEVLSRIASGKTDIQGTIRIAGFSSVVRSVVMPAIADLIKSHPRVNVEIFTRELRDLPKVLATNEADIVVNSEEPLRNEVVSQVLGFEHNVLVENIRSIQERSEIYLDHDPDDMTTINFFKYNKEPTQKLQRNYLDDVYGILEGVRRGWGRAVLPLHLVKGEKDLRVIKRFKPLKNPIMVQYFKQPFYSKLHLGIVQKLMVNIPKILG